MFLNRTITTSIKDCSDKIRRLAALLQEADAIIIGAGAGLSTSAGFAYTGERFERYFGDFKEKYGFLAQTTQNQDVFKEIENMLKSKCNELVVAKTICSATEHRQSAAIEVASNVEVMIVVGGKNSANTTRLYHLCKEICPKTYHVETEKELNADMFLNVENVGLTAGASTPKYLLEKVREYIYEVAR